jgi:hypothetical protein
VPFFKLLARKLPGSAPPIYLNTDTLSFEDAGSPISSLAAPELTSALRRARLPRCVDSLPHEHVRDMQEDHLIKDVVDAKMASPSARHLETA